LGVLLYFLALCYRVPLYMIQDDSHYHIYSTTKDAWDGMMTAIQLARKSIYWELYIFVDDEVGTTFFDVLEKKAKEGVDVKLIVDWFGSFFLSRKKVKALKAAGVDVQIFHARMHRYRGWYKIFRSRTHRKMLIVDEQIGFIGGVNIHKSMEDWLDIHIRLEGVIVRSLLREFAKQYLVSGGKRSLVRHILSYKKRHFLKNIRLVFDDAHEKNSSVRDVYRQAFLKAKQRVILFTPYYLPDKQFIQLLWKARKRGVKIDLLLPFRSDIRIATYAAYAWFGILSTMGINVRFTKQMMHGKGIIVDDDWAMVGSSNITQDSFFDHYEANVAFKDKQFVKTLTAVLSKWFAASVSLQDIGWKKRGIWQRTKEWLCSMIYRVWHH